MSQLQHLVPGGEHDLSWLQVQRATPSWNRKSVLLIPQGFDAYMYLYPFHADPKPDPDPTLELGQVKN